MDATDGRHESEVLGYSFGLDNILQRNNDRQSRYVYLGTTACLFRLMMFIITFYRMSRNISGKEEVSQMAFFIVILTVFYILVFGPRIPGSFHFFREHLPKFSMLWQTAKMMVVSIFFLSIAVSIEFAVLKKILPAK